MRTSMEEEEAATLMVDGGVGKNDASEFYCRQFLVDGRSKKAKRSDEIRWPAEFTSHRPRRISRIAASPPPISLTFSLCRAAATSAFRGSPVPPPMRPEKLHGSSSPRRQRENIPGSSSR